MIDPPDLRKAFGSYPTGVTVVTTRGPDGMPVGFTANSFTSVSLDPPMLLVCPARRLTSFDRFAGCDRFAVSILAEGQEDVANTFASFKGDRFARVATSDDAHGVPTIDGAAARFSCATDRVVDAGDHIVLFGRVDEVSGPGGTGLGFAGGRFFSLELERQAAAAPEPGLTPVAGAIVEWQGKVLLRPSPGGHRPPEVTLDRRDHVREALADALETLGVSAAIDRAYSIFDDRNNGLHYTYFRARATGMPGKSDGALVAIEDLAGLDYVSDAHAAMMKRFAVEYRTRDFGLYVGDERGGEVHH